MTTRAISAWVWRVAAWPVGVVLKLHADVILRSSRTSIAGAGANYSDPAIYVNWHRYPFLVIYHGQHHRWLMISPAPYMDSIAAYSRLAGLRVVRGASGDQGRTALAELTERLRAGDSVVLAVDGPAGPALRVKRGCIDLARVTGAPIIPVAYSSRRGKYDARRWDHWLMPEAFDTIVVTYGEPIWLVGESDAEAATRVEGGLAAICPKIEFDGRVPAAAC